MGDHPVSLSLWMPWAQLTICNGFGYYILNHHLHPKFLVEAPRWVKGTLVSGSCGSQAWVSMGEQAPFVKCGNMNLTQTCLPQVWKEDLRHCMSPLGALGEYSMLSCVIQRFRGHDLFERRDCGKTMELNDTIERERERACVTFLVGKVFCNVPL